MKKQLSILTILLLATSSYAFNNHEACDRNNHGRWSNNQHHTPHHAGKNHRFKGHGGNYADKKITLEEFIILKREKFAQMDVNGDGVLTQNEMKNHRRNRHHKPMKGAL